MKRSTKANGRGSGIYPHSAPTTRPDTSWPNRDALAGVILLLLVVVIYLPTWHAGYLWDDDVLLTANPCIVGPQGLKEIWTTRAADICPLTITALWAEHKLWGLAPLPYHLVNVLLHATCALLLWQVLRRLRVPGAWLGAAFWALHPVQVESVAWISEMKNTLSGVFYLSAVLCFLTWLGLEELADQPRRARSYRATLLCAALAMLSKSSTVVLPVVLCLLAWWKEGRWCRRRLLEVGPIFLLSFLVGIFSSWMQALQPAVSADLQAGRSWPQRFAGAGDAVWFYLGKLVWPHPLITVYPRWSIDAGHWAAFLPLLAALLLLVFLWWRRHVWGSGGLLACGYFLVAIFPVLGFVKISFFQYSFVADHFVYLASMGPLALAGAGLVRLTGRYLPAKQGWLTGAGPLLILGVLSYQQAWVYKSQEALWTDTLAKNPHCWVAYGNLGVELEAKGQLEAAISRFHEALQVGPNDAKTHNNLGYAFLHLGRLDDAVAEYQKAAKANPGLAESYYNLGNVFLQEGQIDNAILQFQAAVKLNENDVAAHGNLGAALKQKGRLDEAVAEYQKALRIDPGNVQNLNNLGNIFLQKGQVDKAINEYQEAVRVHPDDAYTYRNIGNLLSRDGHFDKAISQYQQALKIAPNDAETRNNLGNAFLQKERFDEALAQYQAAVRIDPGNAPAHRNLGLVLARKGRLDEAIAQFQDALRLKPDFIQARQNLDAAEALLIRADPSH